MAIVTVILTSFNHGKYLSKAIDSVLQQSFKNFELFIIDDHSSDNSWEIIKSYNDERITFFKTNVLGEFVQSVNHAIKDLAHGKYIAIHHSDDYWESDKLETQVNFMEANADIGAVFTWAQFINESDDEIDEDWFNLRELNRYSVLNDLFNGKNHLCHPSVLARRECYLKLEGYLSYLRQTPDAEFWSRFCIKYNVGIIKEKLVKYRRFSDQTNTSANTVDTFVRTSNEWSKILKNYICIDSFNFLVQIFPHLENYRRDSVNDIKFSLAMECLEFDKESFHYQQGVGWLFELFLDAKSRGEIERDYSFTFENLIEITGKIDPFNIRNQNQLREKIAQLEIEKINITSEFKTLNDYRATLENGASQLSKTIEVKSDEIERLSKTIEVKSDEIERLSKTIEVKSDEIEHLSKTIEVKSDEIEHLSRHIGGVEAPQVPRKPVSAVFYRFAKQTLKKIFKNPDSNLLLKNYLFSNYPGLFINTNAYKDWEIFTNVRKLEKDLNDRYQKALDQNLISRDGDFLARVLVIDASTPTPDRDAGSVTLWNFLKAFIDLGYETTFIPNDLEVLQPYANKLGKLGIRYLTSENISSIEEYLYLVGPRISYVFLYRVHTAAQNIGMVKKYCPNAKIIFDTVDLHFIREMREALLTNSSELIANANHTKQLEFDVMRLADATIVLSQSERDIIKAEDPAINVHTIPLVLDIPGSIEDFDSRKDIVFIGGFRHQPNIDAVNFFIDEVWPLVTPRLPEARFIVIGSHVPEGVLKKCADISNVEILGYVEDLAPIFDSCKISVAPLRYGAGIKGKIGTSSSYGVPAVATTIAEEGMGMTDGVDILIGDSAEDFANKIVSIYGDKVLWESISKATFEFVEKNYSYRMGKAYLQNLFTLLDSKAK